MPFVGILDQLVEYTLGAGYSVARKLSAETVLGPFIGRRSSDNQTRAAIFDASGEWDQVDMLGWSGGDSVFVAQLNDQGPNGRHFKQVSFAAQPRIINAGVVDTVNSKPAMVLTAVASAMLTDIFTVYDGSVMSAAMVGSIPTAGPNFGRILSASKGSTTDYNSPTNGIFFMREAGSAIKGYRNNADRGSVGVAGNNLTALYSEFPAAGPHAIFRNGDAGTTSAVAGAFDVNRYLLGYENPSVITTASCRLSEAVIWHDQLSSADRSVALLDDVVAFYALN